MGSARAACCRRAAPRRRTHWFLISTFARCTISWLVISRVSSVSRPYDLPPPALSSASRSDVAAKALACSRSRSFRASSASFFTASRRCASARAATGVRPPTSMSASDASSRRTSLSSSSSRARSRRAASAPVSPPAESRGSGRGAAGGGERWRGRAASGRAAHLRGERRAGARAGAPPARNDIAAAPSAAALTAEARLGAAVGQRNRHLLRDFSAALQFIVEIAAVHGRTNIKRRARDGLTPRNGARVETLRRLRRAAPTFSPAMNETGLLMTAGDDQ